jgi:hypothetical protein
MVMAARYCDGTKIISTQSVIVARFLIDQQEIIPGDCGVIARGLEPMCKEFLRRVNI